MKKNIGTSVALYPTPVTVVGAMVDGKVNWTLVAHVGIIGHDRILVSMLKAHRSNIGIRQDGHLSVNIVDEALLPQADYTGCVSGNKTDKSGVFGYSLVEGSIPVIDASPVSMACEVVDNYETETFDNFICRIMATYADEGIIDGKGKIDYGRLHPVLFEMPTYQYLRTGEIIAPCMKREKNTVRIRKAGKMTEQEPSESL